MANGAEQWYYLIFWLCSWYTVELFLYLSLLGPGPLVKCFLFHQPILATLGVAMFLLCPFFRRCFLLCLAGGWGCVHWGTYTQPAETICFRKVWKKTGCFLTGSTSVQYPVCASVVSFSMGIPVIQVGNEEVRCFSPVSACVLAGFRSFDRVQTDVPLLGLFWDPVIIFQFLLLLVISSRTCRHFTTLICYLSFGMYFSWATKKFWDLRIYSRGVILPSSVRIIVNHSKDPMKQPGFNGK